MKKIFCICFFIIAVIILIFITYIHLPFIKYSIGRIQEKNGEYGKAIQTYSKVAEYQDAKKRKIDLIKSNNRHRIETSISNTVMLNEDGSVTLLRNRDEMFQADEWNDMISVSSDGTNIAGLKTDGSVIVIGHNTEGQCDTEALKDIISIDIKYSMLVALDSQGKVNIIGRGREKYQPVVDEWKNVISIATSGEHIIALTADGTVLACGNNDRGQCDVTDWSRIVQVDANSYYTVGLTEDGTVLIAGSAGLNKEIIPLDTTEWKNIISISAANYHCIGLKKNGRVIATGHNENNECDVSNWKDIIEINGGIFDTVGLKKDGSYVSTYELFAKSEVGQQK